MGGRPQRGFSLVELLVSLAVFSMAMASIAGLLVHNSQLNKVQRMRAEVQASARITLAVVCEKLRTAGWDPLNTGLAPVGLDPVTTDPVDFIDVFADLNEDGDVDDDRESMRIRHVEDRVEWRRADGQPFEIVAVDISNDENGDGIPEPMFAADDPFDPRRISVKITAQSPGRDPRTGDFVRFTVRTEIALRSAL